MNCFSDVKKTGQNISKWETDETLPDIRQSKQMALLYRLSLDELIDFDVEVKEIEEVIEKTSEETQEKIDWTNVWAKKYPVLLRYQDEVDAKEYAAQLEEMLDALKKKSLYSLYLQGCSDFWRCYKV